MGLGLRLGLRLGLGFRVRVGVRVRGRLWCESGLDPTFGEQ